MSAPPEEKLRLGGMALANGLLVHGPSCWAAAVRTGPSEIKVASGRKPELGGPGAERVPGVRGVLKLAEAIALVPVVKRALPEARLPFQDARTVGTMGVAAVGGRLIRGGRARRGAPRPGAEAPAGSIGREAAIALLSLAPALMALRTGELAAYHGVEHKAIAGYEDDADAAEAGKEHDRCGSHLVAPMLTAASVGNVAVRRAGLRGPAAEAVVGLGSAALAVEVFAWSERHPDSRLAKLLRRPGYEIQRLVGTQEPTDEQLEVGRAALEEILRVERVAQA